MGVGLNSNWFNWESIWMKQYFLVIRLKELLKQENGMCNVVLNVDIKLKNCQENRKRWSENENKIIVMLIQYSVKTKIVLNCNEGNSKREQLKSIEILFEFLYELYYINSMC